MGQNAIGRFDWLPGTATTLSIVACYGTVVVLGLLSLVGVRVPMSAPAWVGAVGIFALLAVVGMVFGYREHRAIWPLVLAVPGAALVLWAMFEYNIGLTALAGFVVLVVATMLDRRARRTAGST